MIKYYGDDIPSLVYCWSWGKTCPNPVEKIFGRSSHWAYLYVDTQAFYDYLSIEHQDDAQGICWRHSDYLSVPCDYCGAQSPLRAQMSTLPGREARGSGKYVDYHPGDEWPKDIVVWKERGWVYEFFRDTLSDSRFGQETFTVDPKVLELIGQ